MKKQILNVGKALNKAEQKSINGGARRMGECLEADPITGDPILVGYAPCDGSLCPNSGLPFCFNF